MSRGTSHGATLWVAAGVAFGAASSLVLIPRWVPALAASLSGGGKAVWYLTRSSGLTAFVLIWLSTVLGLWLTSRFARLWPGGPVAFALHEHASLLGVAFSLLHALVLLADSEATRSAWELFVPFASSRGRVWLGLGQLALWLSLPVGASFYVRKRLGPRAFRALHLAALVLFFAALLHALWGGSESGEPLVIALYWLAGGSVLFLSVFRALAARFGTQLGSRSGRRSPGSGAS
jgi:predicted ferric reductase